MLGGVSDTAELERRVAALEERLAAVEAVQEIHRLKARYGSLIDTRYTEDGALSGAALEAVAATVSANESDIAKRAIAFLLNIKSSP